MYKSLGIILVLFFITASISSPSGPSRFSVSRRNFDTDDLQSLQPLQKRRLDDLDSTYTPRRRLDDVKPNNLPNDYKPNHQRPKVSKPNNQLANEMRHIPPPQQDKPNFCADNIIVQWARIYLRINRDTFGFLSPPMLARALYMINTAMYDSMSAYKPHLKPTVCRIEKRHNEDTEENVIVAASRAALTVIESIYRNHQEHLDEARQFMRTIQSTYRSSGSAEGIGKHCANEMIESRKHDGANEFGDEPSTKNNEVYSDWTNYYPVNPNQTRIGTTDCRKLNSRNHWQPLLVPTRNGPPKEQVPLSPHMPSVKTFATSLDLLQHVKAPPQLGTPTESDYHKEVQEIIDIYKNLSDEQKMITEYWADGPDSSHPAGHFHFIAIFMIKKKCLSIEDSIKLLFLQSAASMDAGVLAWAVKRYYDYVRPITAIQCSKYENQTITGYKGPYLGFGPIQGKWFQPYQSVFFVTPPFQEYCSGHSAFSAASAEVLKLYFNSDEYGDEVVIKKGESLFEPRIERGQPGFIDGLTNVPNSGAHSVGYSPARDIKLSWRTFTDAAEESGISRLFGAVHFHSGNVNCQKLGRDVGKVVFRKYQTLIN